MINNVLRDIAKNDSHKFIGEQDTKQELEDVVKNQKEEDK